MGNFVDAVTKWQNASADAYEKAGLENPYDPVGMGALKDSLGVPSTGAKLYDMLHDKPTPQALGEAAGIATGSAFSPGIGGVYAGRWILSRPFAAIIKPVFEKVASLGGLKGALSFARDVAEGNNKLLSSAKNIFTSGSKTIPNHWIPDAKQLLKLDDHLKKTQQNQARVGVNPEKISYYLPDQAAKLAATTMGAVNTLNSQRPIPTKPGPLDTEIQPSKGDEAAYQRKLMIAEQPLIVTQHIKDGTFIPLMLQR